MAVLVEYLEGAALRRGELLAEEGERIAVSDSPARVAASHVLFRHEGESTAAIEGELERLASQVEVPLLWEALLAEGPGAPLEARELARLYFDAESDAHASAIWSALCRERFHFRRRGRCFEPRSPDDLARALEQSAAEESARAELAGLRAALLEIRPGGELCQRLERFLRGAADRRLARALGEAGGGARARAFELLCEAGHLPPTAALDELLADLRAEHPAAALAHAASLEPWRPARAELAAAFSIDDLDTREIDDALGVGREGELVRVEIDIADPGALCVAGDPVDREAARRATSVYLPTGTIHMLPPRLGCELGSLRAGELRPALRFTAWLDAGGGLVRHSLARVAIRVAERLDYGRADELIARGEGATAEALRLLHGVALGLAGARRAAGALAVRRREWKLRVSPDAAAIEVTPIAPDSPSRALIAETMILANTLAAREAWARGLACIYRTQPAAEQAPAGARRLLPPAALSLQPGRHHGLGVEAYAQVSSPLRRYADLVLERQLVASLAGQPAPYGDADLLAVLGTAEETEREAKRVEGAAFARWALEHASRLPAGSPLRGEIVAPAAGGWRVQLELDGAVGTLRDGRPHELGESVEVELRSVRPREGIMRLAPARR